MESTNNYMETDLGNVSPNPKGTYDNATAYEYLDLVEYQGGSYLCTVDIDKKVKGISPVAGQNSETWQLVALPGTSTEEYVAKHTEVIEKAKQVETSRAAVELCKQEVESAQADVEQMRKDTQQSAQSANDANTEAQQAVQQAEASRSAAQTSEQNAAASRDLANTYKANAETAKSAAETAAQNATESKTAAETAAQNAAQSKADIDNIKAGIEEAAKGENVSQIQKNMNDIGSLKESKIDSDQGKNNKGKYLSVGEDGNIALSDPPSNGGEVKDANGNKYLIYVKDDGTLGAKKVKELFSGKQIVSRTDLTKYEATTSGNRYCFKDMITGESTYSGPSGWYPLKSFDNEGQSSTFKTTKAYETLLANTTGEYSFITNATTYFLGQQIGALTIRDTWKSNVGVNTQPGDKLYIWVSVDDMPYLNNSGELKTFSITKYNTNIMQKDTKGALANQMTQICAVVLLKDGTIRIIYNGTTVAEQKAPDDFAKWDFSFYATQTGVSAGIIAPNRLTSVGKEYIIVNDAVTEQELIDYYGLYIEDKTMITTQDYICMNKNDKVTLSYGVTPEIFKDSVVIESNDTSIVAVKGNVITAINEGEARLTLTFANATSEIVVYVGKEVSDVDKVSIEALSDRTVNKILIVNEIDFPETFYPDDEFAVYALGIDTTN